MSPLVTAEIFWPVDENDVVCTPGLALAGSVLSRIKALDVDTVAEAAGSYYDVVLDELLGGVRELFDGTAVFFRGVLVAQNSLLRVIHAGDREIVLSAAFHSEDDAVDDVDNPVAMAVGFVSELGILKDPVTI